MGALSDILRQNEFHASTNIGSSADLNTSAGKFFFFSATRSRGAEGRGAGFGRRSVKLVLDGQKLGQRYKGFPIDYWNYSSKESDWSDKANYINSLKSKELEDRIVLDGPTISNAASYILEIHISIKDGGEMRKDELDELMGYVKKYNIPIYFYTDRKYYFNQVKDKSVDPYKVLSWDEEPRYVSRSSGDKLWGIDHIIYLLMYNDDGNRDKIFNYFNFSSEELEYIDRFYKQDVYNYLGRNAMYDNEYYGLISADVHNARSNSESKYKFIFKMLADDIRKYGAKNLKEYIAMKRNSKLNEEVSRMRVVMGLNEVNQRLKITPEYLKKRIPFFNLFNDFSESNWIRMQKIVYNPNVTWVIGDSMYKMSQLNTVSEFSHTVDRMDSERYRVTFSLRNDIIIMPGDGEMDDLLMRALMYGIKSQSERLSYLYDEVHKTADISDELLDKIINDINGVFFKFEDYITNHLRADVKNPLDEND
jgi:hypothetical protein